MLHATPAFRHADAQASFRSPARRPGADAAGGRALTTTLQCCGIAWMSGRDSARRRLLTRLRMTAPPTAFDTTKPTCAAEPVAAPPAPTSERRRTCTTRVGRPTRMPPRTVRENSADDRSRLVLGTPALHADSSARPLRRRAARMARPARVRMRALKPCVRARRRLLGWNVRLTMMRTTFTVFRERPRIYC